MSYSNNTALRLYSDGDIIIFVMNANSLENCIYIHIYIYIYIYIYINEASQNRIEETVCSFQKIKQS